MAKDTNIANNSQQQLIKVSTNTGVSQSDEATNNQFQAQSAKEAKQQKVQARQTENFNKANSKIGDKARQAFGIKAGQTTATGLEKAIFIAGDGILKAQFAIDGLFYGKFENRSGNKLKQAIDKGVVNILNDLSEIDLCQILNYALQQVPGSKSFDPEDIPKDPLGFAKYKVQKAAYDTQLKIDGFYSSYLESDDPQTKAKGVYEIIKEIKDAFKEINDPEAQSALRDPRLLSAFPQMGPVNSFLEKAFGDFNRYTDYRQIPSEDLQNLITKVDRIRQYTILLQGLNTPANAIGFIDSVFPNANIQELIQNVQKIIDPARLMPLLKNIVESLKKVQSICNVFVTFVTTAQVIIKIAILLTKVLKIVVSFLKKLPIPNTFTVLGVTNTLSGFCEDILKKISAFQDRLSQINTLLGLCVGLFTELSVILYDMIAKINRMLATLEACSNVDPTIIKDLQDTRDGLQKTADYFTKFVDNYASKKGVDTATFGDYTIQIVTEEVVDEAITLRRRYGVALATNGTAVVQSTPTFASDNLIIINETKALLAAKGFVKQNLSNALSLSEANTISESMSFLFDDDISLNDLENLGFDTELDPPDNEDENVGLGLNAFVNKLQGGKKLRQRMRKSMIKNAQSLQKDLKAQDPEGKYTGNLVAQARQQESKYKIEELQSERNKLIAAAAITPNPISKALLLKKAKEIEDEITKLKKESK